MSRTDKAEHLKFLISNFLYEARELEDMVNRWKKHDDPGSDPGLQYEQEMKMDEEWKELVNFAKQLDQ
jgi:hypothetical protein